MLRNLLVGLLAFCVAGPAFAADQVPLKRNNGIPAPFGTGDTVGVAHGGTGAAAAGGTTLDNISGFASTGFLTRTGAGTYSFQSLTNGISLGNIAQIGANTVLGNATGSTANITALSLTDCHGTGDAVTYTAGTGFSCHTISSGSGTVTTTGSPASGNLAKFSGTTSVTNGDLSGDVTTSGTLATTIANSAVTLAKIANASASSKLLGSGASGSGSPYAEITLGTGLTMTGTTLSSSGSGAAISGTPTAGNCASWTNSTTIQDAGAACGSGGGGALVLLEAHTASSSSALNFTTSISSTYDDYQIEVVNLLPATNNVELQFEVSTDGGSTYQATNYFWNYSYAGTSADSGIQGGGLSATYAKFGTSVSNSATGGGVTSTLRLYSPLSSSFSKILRLHTEYFHQNGAYYSLIGGGGWNSTTAVNAFRIRFSSGNIASGTVRVYGIAH